jgi:N-acetyl-gamma-glutamylphosphate reductase
MLLELYKDYYAAAEFVQVYDLPKEQGATWQYKPYPWISSVVGTNNCFIGLDVDVQRGRVLIVSVLDSLGKGGAQVGVENMNLLFGMPPTEGLSRYGLHP